MKITKDELKNIITEAVKNILAYHGSNNNFNEFDLAYINNNSHNQSKGYGFYATLYKNYDYGNILYTILIPPLNKKYIYNNKIYKGKELEYIKDKLFQYLININDDYKGIETDLLKELNSINNITGSQIYGTIDSYIGNPKETSNLLYDIGYHGLVYDDDKILIFNPKDITIIKKENSK